MEMEDGMTDEKKLLEAQLKDAQDIARKARERLDVIERKEAAERLEPLKATAARAHDLLCPYNHTDGCSWGYEGDSWSGDAHSRWLRKIDGLANGGPYEKPKATLAEINLVLDAVEDLKPKVKTAIDLIRRGLIA
jgi:hypothetical protein